VKKILAAAVLIIAGLSSSALAQTPAPAAVTVLKAARMFDGRSDATIANAVVVIEGSKIREAGSNLPIPAGATVVDLGDATLLPGFIDSHMHLTFEAGDNYVADFFEDLRRTVPERTLMSGGNARKLLEAGFTTVRNVGAFDDMDVGLRNAIARGIVPGPRMLVSRYPIGSTGGHCDQTGFPPNTFGPDWGPAKGTAAGRAAPGQIRRGCHQDVRFGGRALARRRRLRAPDDRRGDRRRRGRGAPARQEDGRARAR
jgi:imidazolonepropionase-like amidohydrolase